jgi:hypothetical protein
LASDINQQFDWEQCTEELVAWASATLIKAREESGGKPWKRYEDLGWYLETIMIEHKIASDHLAQGKGSGAACAALRMGQTYAEMRFKFNWEPAALTGAEVRKGAVAGGKARGTADSTNDKRQRLLAEYQKRVGRMEPVDARRYAAKEVGYSERQARRIIPL